MNFLRHQEAIDAVAPGVASAYRQLRNSGGQGLYTSMGRYYNHTIFGRDAGMTAKFVAFFDHEVAWQTIQTLAAYQGQRSDGKTHEQRGKIHHEMRDYMSWRGSWYDRLGLGIIGHAWGRENRKLVTYYAADATATYIRLVNKYTQAIDPSIITRQVPQRDGTTVTLAESVARAADWIVGQVDQRGGFWTERTNRLSLPYQTFADSVSAYAWTDRSPADASRRHCFVEVQAYAIDALQDAARLLPRHPSADSWRLIAGKMQRTLFDDFWQSETETFSPGLFVRDGEVRPLDNDMITATWTLNTSFWEDIPEVDRRVRIEAIVRRAFAGDFLTDYGIRTKSLQTTQPLGDVIDYHGSQTIWPMFNFMFIEGLRRHGLFRLARQIEIRLLNTINALGDFPEFFIVDHGGILYRPDRTATLSRPGQMIPEQNIGFTIVPTITLAYRLTYPRSTIADSGWAYDLEQSVLDTIPSQALLSPDEARRLIQPTGLRIRRSWAGLKSAALIAPVMLRRSSGDD